LPLGGRLPRGKAAATPVGTDVAAFSDAGSIPAASTIASFEKVVRMGGNGWSVGLAGLLHDIGKFSQRVGNEQRWRHEEFTETFLKAFSDKLGNEAEKVLQLAATSHQQMTERDGLCVKLADWLASAERQRRQQPQIAPERTALIAIPSQVQLKKALSLPAYPPLRRLTFSGRDFSRQTKGKFCPKIIVALGTHLQKPSVNFRLLSPSVSG